MKKKARRRRSKPELHAFTAEVDEGLYGWPRETPVSEGEQVWLEHAVALAIAYSREARGEDMEARLLDLTAIGRAAELLWAASSGSPHWRDLDADALVLSLVGTAMDRLRDNAIAALLGFTCFLAKHGHLTPDEALVVRSRLDRYVPVDFLALGYRPAVLPPGLLPC